MPKPFKPLSHGHPRSSATHRKFGGTKPGGLRHKKAHSTTKSNASYHANPAPAYWNINNEPVNLPFLQDGLWSIDEYIQGIRQMSSAMLLTHGDPGTAGAFRVILATLDKLQQEITILIPEHIRT